MPTTVTVMLAMLEPRMFVAVMVTTYEQLEKAQVKVCWRGSWSLEVVPSAKFQAHEVGLPPDVSRNSTSTTGPMTVIEFGVIVLLALKAALGADPPVGVPPPLATALMPVLTAKLDSAVTWTEPPRMFEMNGVMTPNVHVMR